MMTDTPTNVKASSSDDVPRVGGEDGSRSCDTDLRVGDEDGARSGDTDSRVGGEDGSRKLINDQPRSTEC
jgi:hypothetical protein